VLSIVVRLQVMPGRREEFLEVILENATASLRDEPGCRHFDVATLRDDPDTVLLYETYDDEAAFQAHQATPHFALWRAARTDLVVDGSQVTERFDVALPQAAR
jgi:quinol monooxygenase YgiN